MKSRMYWGLGALVFLIIVANILFILNYRSEIRELKQKLAIATEGFQHSDEIQHHDDFEEDASSTDVSEEERPAETETPDEVPKRVKDTEPKTETPKPQKPLYTGPLTFHEELMKTNPVKALRLQQEERGHWSAKWIPPFPTDDTEAQEFARARYLRLYYIQNYGFEKLGTPGYEKETKVYREAREISSQMRDTIVSYPYGARQMDLMKLMWPGMDEEPRINHYGGFPSEYFGDAEARERLKQLGMWDY